MQIEWVEAVLRPFTIIYSVVLVFIMDMMLIESRFSKRLYALSTTVCVILSCTALILLYQLKGIEVMQKCSFLMCTLPSCVMYYFFSKHRGCRFFLAFCTADIACMAMVMLSMTLGLFMKGDLFFVLIARIVLTTLITVFMLKWVAKPFCRILNDVQKGWGAAAFVTFLFYMLLYGYFLTPTTIEKRPEYVPVGILILVLLFSVYWFIYKTISWLSEIHLAEKTEQGLRLQLALQKEQYGTIQEKIKADQVFRHDLRHHANVLGVMLEKGNFGDALLYTRKISNYTLESTTKSYCENVVVNAVLDSHLKKARQLGLQVMTKVVLPKKVRIDEMELCVVLSNLLENAIEHCSSVRVKPPVLIVSIKKNKEQICIRIQNHFDGDVKQNESGDYLSSKPQGGIGLKSVKAIVEKYEGVIDVSHTENMFSVDVAM